MKSSMQHKDYSPATPNSSDAHDPKTDSQRHWDKAYSDQPMDQLGWYEDMPEPSLSLIKKSGIESDARQLHAGVGGSTLIDHLLDSGYTRLIANDISPVALDRLRERIGEASKKIHWIVDDLSKPGTLNTIEPIDLWHDRAVLHFLLDADAQKAYFDLIRKVVRPGGRVIIGVFNLKGAEKCSGLSVFRYDHQMLVDRMGDDFELIEHFDYTFVNPRGEERPYVYTSFERRSKLNLKK